MTRLDAIEKYKPAKIIDCPFCFFGIVVAGLCSHCDGRDAIDAALERINRAIGYNRVDFNGNYY